MDQIIREAIENRRVLEFQYDGGPRIVEPFCYGIGKTGKHLLRGYQTAGYSSSGNPVGWRLFDLAKMSAVSATSVSFLGDRPEYVQNDSAMVHIFSCVQG
ncbi:MAG TPA: hypothetical protein VHG28_11045 [Longimicrobiaceae bacterium]|nr:hypothetical protein [Longimicrobiaceae bacterium]